MGKILLWLQERVKLWTKPSTPAFAVGLLSDHTRSRTEPLIENALLRQLLIILKRQIKRPQLTDPDRFHLVFLSRFTKFWKQVLHIHHPDTFIHWHQNLFRRCWQRKSQGRRKVESETIILIQKMANENRWWGAERTHGELLKLGIEVSKRSIPKYTPKDRKGNSSSRNWATFLKNQAGNTWACDFTAVNDWLFRQWYIFVVMELKTRRIVHTGDTKFPTSHSGAGENYC